MVLEKLREFKEYAESVLQNLESVAQNPPPQENWVPAELTNCIERIREAAIRTARTASSPVKIGVMGEFSSGKTLLLGSLIGYADALPVSETPTTGNVTAIHLVQQEGFHTTQVNQFTVYYLNHEEVKDCLRFMLQETEQRATKAGLTAEQIATLKSLNPTDAGVGNGILRWIEQVWNITKNLELRYLLRELVVFVRTYNSCGTAICGRQYQVNATTAKEGLILADPPMDIQGMTFENLPPAPGKWVEPLGQLSANDLQNTFSLIRRLDIKVELSKKIWDLSGLQSSNKFVLLDFPGLGAANSGVRDTYLSLRELAEVQTILILLNGTRPGAGTAAEIYTMMEQHKGQDLKDRILVGVGRFNQLPLSGTDEQIIDELIGEEIEDDLFQMSQLKEDEVLEKLKILKITIALAQALTTQKERIVLLSQIFGLTELAKLSSTLQVSSPEFAVNLENLVNQEESKRRRQQWEQLSSRLVESTLSRQLSDFATDGGIGRLRALMVKHVAEHGLKQVYDDTRRAADVLRREQNHLKNLVEQIKEQGIPITENTDLIVLRAAIENLVRTYREFQENIGKTPLQDRRGLDVGDVVKDELTYRIMNEWSEWNVLFNKISKGTIAPLTQTQDRSSVAAFFGADEDVEDPIPTKSDDFYPAFQKTVKELESFARSRIREAVIDLLSKLSAQVAPERDNIRAIVQEPNQQQLQQKFGNKEANLLTTLLRSYEPKQWQEIILPKINVNNDTSPPIAPETIFPLARQDEKHEIGQNFDWGPKKNPVTPRAANHQILLLRLRDEMIASPSLHLVELVSQGTKQVNSTLIDILQVIIPSLQQLAKKEALLRYIASGEQQQGATPAWLQTLSQLASISYPN